jgi:hypothetical protein
MSGRIVGEILDNAPTDLTLAEFLVLIAVGEDARDTDRRARFSDLRSLERRTRLAPGTIRNALSSLTRRALLTTVHDKAYRGGHHQEYVVTKLHDYHRDATITPLHNDVNQRERVTGS